MRKKSSPEDIEREREANEFALCLLMPEKLVRKWMNMHEERWNLTEDDVIKAFARDFQVSMTCAVIRLTKLGYFKV